MMKALFLSIIASWMLFPCLAQDAKTEAVKPPPVELQLGLQLEYPSLRIIGRFQNNKFPIFRTSFLGQNDNPIVFRDLNGKSMYDGWGAMRILTIVEYEEPSSVKPIQLRIGESAWLDEKISSLSLGFTGYNLQDGFVEIFWPSLGIRVPKEVNNGKHFESNGIIFYFDGGFKKFDPASIPVKQDLDLVFAPKVIVCDLVKFTEDCYESRDLIFFMRNNARQKILAVLSESLAVLTVDGKPVVQGGQPFTIAIGKTKGTALEPDNFIKESQSLQDVQAAFAKTTLPAGFYRLQWQVEVEYADHEKKRFSSSELWIYHGKYEATKSVKKNLEGEIKFVL